MVAQGVVHEDLAMVMPNGNLMIIDDAPVAAAPPAPVPPPAPVAPPALVALPGDPPAAAAAAAPLSLALVPMGQSPAKRNRSDGSSEDGNVVSTALVAVPPLDGALVAFSARAASTQAASDNGTVASRTRRAKKKPRGRKKKAQDSLDDGTLQEQIDFAPRGDDDDDDDGLDV